MNEPTDKPSLSRTALVMLVALGITSAGLLSTGSKDYPDLHTILDTAMFLLSGLLASLFWDIGVRGDRPFPKWIAISFALTSLSEFLHTLASLDWSGFYRPIAHATEMLRPATWPPAAYVLPIGIGCSVWLTRIGGQRVVGFALGLIILAAALFTAFHWLPRYTSPGWLGITRPAFDSGAAVVGARRTGVLASAHLRPDALRPGADGSRASAG